MNTDKASCLQSAFIGVYRRPENCLRLDGSDFAEVAPQIAEVAFDAGSVAEEEARHEAEDHVVDLAILGDAHDTAFGGGGDLDGPRAAEGQVLSRDAGDPARGHFVLDQLVGDFVPAAILLP